MKKLFLLVVIVCAVFVLTHRQRLYMRDPLANVTRDGVKEDGAMVFINYSNDVFVENDHAPMYVLLVQHDQHAGAPLQMKCMHWMVCLADADVATLAEPMGGQVGEMSGKLVAFHDDKGRNVQVTLR